MLDKTGAGFVSSWAIQEDIRTWNKITEMALRKNIPASFAN